MKRKAVSTPLAQNYVSRVWLQIRDILWHHKSVLGNRRKAAGKGEGVEKVKAEAQIEQLDWIFKQIRSQGLPVKPGEAKGWLVEESAYQALVKELEFPEELRGVACLSYGMRQGLMALIEWVLADPVRFREYLSSEQCWDERPEGFENLLLAWQVLWDTQCWFRDDWKSILEKAKANWLEQYGDYTTLEAVCKEDKK